MKKSKMIFVSLFIAVTLMLCFSGAAHAEDKVSFTLNQSSENVAPGQGLEITFYGHNLDNLYAYEAVLSFDPAVVEFDEAKSKLEGFFIPPKVKDGEMKIAFTKIGKKEGEKGSLPLCTIAFKGKTESNANVRLVSVKALDQNLAAVEYKIGSGLIKTFTDLTGFEWARMQIEALTALGIIKGTSETTFSPGMNITRADFICLLVRSLEFTADVDSNFIDVSLSDYFYEEVGIARKLGITLGVGNNRFKPRENITRQDIMVLVSRALKMKGILPDEQVSDLSMFSDSGEVAPYALNSVAQLVREGIILGNKGRVFPRGTATRAETAVIMYRILHR